MEHDPFDPGELGQPVALGPPRPAPLPAEGLPRPTAGELYLGGPIPLGWLVRAAALPGRVLNVALALWFEALVRKPKSPIVQPRRITLTRFGAGCRRTLYRALRALERTGLIRVERRPGRPFLVTILPAEPLARRGRGVSAACATPSSKERRAATGVNVPDSANP